MVKQVTHLQIFMCISEQNGRLTIGIEILPHFNQIYCKFGSFTPPRL